MHSASKKSHSLSRRFHISFIIIVCICCIYNKTNKRIVFNIRKLKENENSFFCSPRILKISVLNFWSKSPLKYLVFQKNIIFYNHTVTIIVISITGFLYLKNKKIKLLTNMFTLLEKKTFLK